MTRLPASPQPAMNQVPQDGISSQQDPEGKYLAEFKKLQAQQQPQRVEQTPPETPAGQLLSQIDQSAQIQKTGTRQKLDTLLSNIRAQDQQELEFRKIMETSPQTIVHDESATPAQRLAAAEFAARKSFEAWKKGDGRLFKEHLDKWYTQDYTPWGWLEQKSARDPWGIAADVPVAGLGASIAQGYDFYAAGERFKRGEATPHDYNLMAEAAIAEKHQNDRSLVAKGYDIASMVPSFIVDLMLTGGLFKAGVTAGSKAARRGLVKTLGKSAAKSTAGKVATRAAGLAAGTAARFKPGFKSAPFLARMAPDVLERMTNNPRLTYDKANELQLIIDEGDDLAPAFMKAATDLYIEAASEALGEDIGKGAAALMKLTGGQKLFSKMGSKVGLAKFLTWFAEKSDTTSTSIRAFARRGEFHGLLNEYAEERAGELMRMGVDAATGSDLSEGGGVIPSVLEGKYKEAYEQTLTELIGFGLISGGALAGDIVNKQSNLHVDRAKITFQAKVNEVLAENNRTQFLKLTPEQQEAEKTPEGISRRVAENLDRARKFVQEVDARGGTPSRQQWDKMIPWRADSKERKEITDQIRQFVTDYDTKFAPDFKSHASEESQQALLALKDAGMAEQEAVVIPGRGKSEELKFLERVAGADKVSVVKGLSGPAFVIPQTGQVMINYENVMQQDPKKPNVLWKVVGDEISHLTGLDQNAEIFSDEESLARGELYFQRVPQSRRDKLATYSPEKQQEVKIREGRAALIAEVIENPKFRDELFKRDRPLLRRAADAIVGWFTGKPRLPSEFERVLKPLRDILNAPAPQEAPQAEGDLTMQDVETPPVQPEQPAQQPVAEESQEPQETPEKTPETPQETGEQVAEPTGNQEESPPSSIPPESGPTGQDVPKTEEGRVPDGAKDTKTPQESDPETALDEESIPDGENAVDADMPPEDEAVTQEGGDTTPVATPQTAWQPKEDDFVNVSHDGETWSGLVKGVSNGVATVEWYDEDGKSTGETYDVPVESLEEREDYPEETPEEEAPRQAVNYTFVSGLQSSTVEDISNVTDDIDRDEPLHLGFSLSRPPSKESKAYQAAVAFVNTKSGKIFVDSGAFQSFIKQQEYSPKQWGSVLEWYREFIAEIKPQYRKNVVVVAPDVVGDQTATYDLLEQHREAIDDLVASGAKVMVNLQKGDLSMSENASNLSELFNDWDQIVLGIPFNKAAYTQQDVLDFLPKQVAAIGPQDFVHIHLLGGGEAKVKEMAEAAAEIASNIIVSGDASKRQRIRKKVDSKQFDPPEQDPKEKADTKADFDKEKADLKALWKAKEITFAEFKQRTADIVKREMAAQEQRDIEDPEEDERPEPIQEDTPEPTQAPTLPVGTFGTAQVFALPQSQVASFVDAKLSEGGELTKKELLAEGDRVFPGSRANGDYSESDIYDGMEAGINLFLSKDPDAIAANSPRSTLKMAKEHLATLEYLLERIPTQTESSDKKQKLQQFSTPTTYSYVATWLAGINENDTMLEPSAGTGDLAVNAAMAGANVVTNEWDESRALLLRFLSESGAIPKHHGAMIDAEALHDIGRIKGLPYATVVVMNPPFSVSQKTRKASGKDLVHIDQALAHMSQGGRLVAIIGAGLHGETKTFQRWLAKTKESHGVRVNVTVTPDVYKKFGTTFPTRLLVIDKGQVDRQDDYVAENVSLEEVLENAESVRSTRPVTSQQDFVPAEVLSASKQPGTGGSVQSPTVSGGPGGVPGVSTDDAPRKKRQSRKPSSTPKQKDSKTSDKGTRGAGSGAQDRPSGGTPDTPPSSGNPWADLGNDMLGAEPGVPSPETAADPPGHSVAKRDHYIELLVNYTMDLAAENPSMTFENLVDYVRESVPQIQEMEANQQAEALKKMGYYIENVWDKLVDLMDLTPRAVNVFEVAESLTKKEEMSDLIREVYQKLEPSAAPQEIDLGVFEVYDTYFDAGAPTHKALMVETAPMKAVKLPKFDKKYLSPIDHLIAPGGNSAWGVSDTQADVVFMYRRASDQRVMTEVPTMNESTTMQDMAGGVLVGDGTGAGKGRTATAVIADTMKIKNLKKAVWISKNDDLFDDAMRDWTEMGQDPQKLIRLKDLKDGFEGVVFASYDTIKGSGGGDMSNDEKLRYKTNRIAQIMRWLGEDYDGVIIADEAHLVNNTGTDDKDGSARAEAFMNLMASLPNASPLYLTATSATEIAQYRFLDRLGLWGRHEDAAFDTFDAMTSALAGDELTAMEVIASNLKARGKFIARTISLKNSNDPDDPHNVVFDQLKVRLFDGADDEEAAADMRRQYDAVVFAMRQVIDAIHEESQNAASDISNRRKNIYSGALRIFADVMQSLMVPKMLSEIQKDLDNGHRVVIQSSSTNDARNKRAYARYLEALAEGKTPEVSSNLGEEIVDLLLDNYDVKAYRKVEVPGSEPRYEEIWGQQDVEKTYDEARELPLTGKGSRRELLMQIDLTFDPSDARNAERYTEHRRRYMNPTFQVEGQKVRNPDYIPTAEINRRLTEAFANGTPQEWRHMDDPEKVATRDRMVEQLRELDTMFPVSPMDAIHARFDQRYGVSEITGREYMAKKKHANTVEPEGQALENGKWFWHLRKNLKRAKNEDEHAFNNGDNRILIFSDAGGTGKSYNSSRTYANQERRVHYVLWAGWRADSAIQGFGRTHRTNQANAPIWRLVSTDIPVHARFISTIARRIAQMGAITKGERSASSGVFTEDDNFDTKYGRAAAKIQANAVADGASRVFTPEMWEDFIKIKIGSWENDDTGERTFTKSDSRIQSVDLQQLLNRYMIMPLELQREAFDELDTIRKSLIEVAKRENTYSTGLKWLKGEEVRYSRRVAHPNENIQTEYKHLTAKVERKKYLLEELPDLGLHDSDLFAFGLKPMPGGKLQPFTVKVQRREQDERGAMANILAMYYPHRKTTDVAGERAFKEENPDWENWILEGGKWTTKEVVHQSMGSIVKEVEHTLTRDLWREKWQDALDALSDYTTTNYHFITGELLPFWTAIRHVNRNVSLARVMTEDGEQVLGAKIDAGNIGRVLDAIGMGETAWPSDERIITGLLEGSISSVAFINDASLSSVTRKDGTFIQYKKQGDAAFNAEEQQELSELGFFSTRDSGKRKYFLPVQDGLDVFKRFKQRYPINEIRESASFEGNIYGAPITFDDVKDPMKHREDRMNREIPKDTWKESMSKGIERLSKLFRRHKEIPEGYLTPLDLLDKAKRAEKKATREANLAAMEYFRLIKLGPTVADNFARDFISEVASKLETDPERYLFGKFIVLRNHQVSTLGRGELVRFGFDRDAQGNRLTVAQTARAIQEEYKRIEDLAFSNKNVKAAINRHDAMQEEHARQLYEAKLISKEHFENSRAYFHQMVMEYQSLSRAITQGGGAMIHQDGANYQKPRIKAEFQRDRDEISKAGVEEMYDYVTNYAEAQYVYLRTSKRQLIESTLANKMVQHYDVSNDIRMRARRENRLAMVGGIDALNEIKALRALIKLKSGQLRAMSISDIVARVPSAASVQFSQAGGKRKSELRALLNQLDPEHKFTIKMGRARAALLKTLGAQGLQNLPTTGPGWMQLIGQSKKGDYGRTAMKQAGWWLSALHNREKERARVLGESYQTESTILASDPQYEGYEMWQPKRGHNFYTVLGVTESLADAMMQEWTNPAGEFVIPEAELQRYSVKGALKPYFIIPGHIKRQLDELERGDRVPTAAGAFFNGMQKHMKMWTLLQPTRMLAYNFRNITGDFDPIVATIGMMGPEEAKLFAGKTKEAFKLVTEYYRPLQIKTKRTHKIPKGVLKEAIELGVIGTSFSAIDLPDTKTMKQLMEMDNNVVLGFSDRAKLVAKYGKDTVKWYFDNARTFTEWRESIFRMAAFLYAKEKMASGDIKHGGGSKTADLKVIRSQIGEKEAAAKFARDLLGDYGDLSVAGEWVKNYIMWFWSFQEVNGRRYWNIIANGIEQSKADFAKRGVVLGITTGTRMTASMAALTSFLWIINNLFSPDDEEQLSFTERMEPHLIVPKWIHGSDEIVILRNVGALGDIGEWVGGFGMPQTAKLVASGQSSVGEAVKEHIFKAPVNKVAQGLSPWIKGPFEMATGTAMYPDAFNPRSIEGRRGEHFANMFGMGDPYREISGRLGNTGRRSRMGSWSSITAQVVGGTKRDKNHTMFMPWRMVGMSSPHRYALDETYDLRDRFLKRKSAGVPTRGSMLFRNMREAAEYGDYGAFLEAKASWVREKNSKVELSERELYKRFKRATSALQVVKNRMSDADEAEFYKWLTPSQRQKVQMAEDHASNLQLQLWLWWHKSAETDALKTDDIVSTVQALARPRPMAITKAQREQGVTIADLRDSWERDQEAARKWLSDRGISKADAVDAFKQYLVTGVKDRKDRRLKYQRLLRNL